MPGRKEPRREGNQHFRQLRSGTYLQERPTRVSHFRTIGELRRANPQLFEEEPVSITQIRVSSVSYAYARIFSMPDFIQPVSSSNFSLVERTVRFRFGYAGMRERLIQEILEVRSERPVGPLHISYA
jgi:hypothetical protein